MRQFGRFAQGDKPVLKYRIKGSLSIAAGTRVPFDESGEFDVGTLRSRL